MAPWVMHLRVAEIINRYLKCQEIPFYVGSIAPDSGRKLDGFTYDPPKNISHCYEKGMDRILCNDKFLKKYALNEKDPFKKAFFLGYYVHILTDTIFVDRVVYPLIESKGRDFWKSNVENIRNSWFEIDFRFLDSKKEFHPLECLNGLDSFPDGFLPFFRNGDIYDRIDSIKKKYNNSAPDYDLELYGMNEKSADEFVQESAEIITQRLKEKFGF